MFRKPKEVYQKIKEGEVRQILRFYGLSFDSFYFAPLYGGYRNAVFKINNTSMVYVLILYRKDSFSEKDKEAAIEVENWVAVNTPLPARRVIKNKNEKILTKINLWGKKCLAALFYYIPGEPVFSLNCAQIASAGQLLSRLHFYLKNYPGASTLKIWPKAKGSVKNQVLHLDFGRGNILYKGKKAVGIIDFESVAKGPIEADLARSLSFLFVDTPLEFGKIREAFLEGYFSARRDKFDPKLLNRLTIYFLEKIKKDLGKTFSDPELSAHPNFIKAQAAIAWLRQQ